MKDVLDSRAAWITASAALAIMTIAYGAPLVVVLAAPYDRDWDAEDREYKARAAARLKNK